MAHLVNVLFRCNFGAGTFLANTIPSLMMKTSAYALKSYGRAALARKICCTYLSKKDMVSKRGI
jgi:hypothetical protein